MSEEQKPEDTVKEWMTGSIPAALDRAYDLGLEHAIVVVNGEWESFLPDRVLNAIISKIQQLKKQPTPTCSICSRIIEEEAHHCEISDCPHR